MVYTTMRYTNQRLLNLLYLLLYFTTLSPWAISGYLSDFFGDVVLDVRHHRQLVAVLRRRRQVAAVALSFVERPSQLRADVARARLPTAAVVDRHVPGLGLGLGLGEVESHPGRIHRRTH